MRANKWFSKRATQGVRTNLSQEPVIIATGPNIQSPPSKKPDEEKSFEAGVSEVGGEEVV